VLTGNAREELFLLPPSLTSSFWPLSSSLSYESKALQHKGVNRPLFAAPSFSPFPPLLHGLIPQGQPGPFWKSRNRSFLSEGSHRRRSSPPHLPSPRRTGRQNEKALYSFFIENAPPRVTLDETCFFSFLCQDDRPSMRSQKASSQEIGEILAPQQARASPHSPLYTQRLGSISDEESTGLHFSQKFKQEARLGLFPPRWRSDKRAYFFLPLPPPPSPFARLERRKAVFPLLGVSREPLSRGVKGDLAYLFLPFSFYSIYERPL